MVQPSTTNSALAVKRNEPRARADKAGLNRNIKAQHYDPVLLILENFLFSPPFPTITTTTAHGFLMLWQGLLFWIGDVLENMH